MHVLMLLGSPRRKGNSATLANIVADHLAQSGGTTTAFYLNDLVFKGCQACGACKTKSETCVVNDDLAPVLAAIAKADVIIMATPVYWGEVSAQIKGFIDRLYSFLTPDFMTSPVKHRLPAGKRLVFIQTQGASAELYDDIFPRYNLFFEQLAMFESTDLIRACDLNAPGDAGARREIVDLARATADRVVSGRQPNV